MNLKFCSAVYSGHINTQNITALINVEISVSSRDLNYHNNEQYLFESELITIIIYNELKNTILF